MKRNTINLGLKSVSLILSGVLVFQCTAPSFAAAMPAQSESSLAEGLDRAYLQSNTSDAEYRSRLKKNLENQGKLVTAFADKIGELRKAGLKKYNNNYLKANMYVQLEGVNVIGQLTHELKRFLSAFYTKREILPLSEFTKAYNEHISSEAKEYAKENNYSAAELEKLLKKEYPVAKLYADYKKIANEELNWYKTHKAEVDDIGYQILRKYVNAYGVNMDFEAVRLLANLKLAGKDVLLPAEKNDIYNYAVDRLSSLNLDKVFDIGILSSSATKEKHSKVAAKVLKDNIELMISAAYVAPSNHSSLTRVIKELIVKSQETAAYPHFLQAGIGSLLALKDYENIDAILADCTKKEANGDSFWDMLSFEYAINAINNIQGQYLNGVPSRSAQYVSESNITYYNAFTDIAKLLGEEGSARSINLLEKYGTKNKKPIYPFLVGALLTGKAKANAVKDNSKGLSPEAVLAIRLANTNFADISANQELNIDAALAQKYPDVKKNAGEYAIINTQNLHAKDSRRNTLGYFQRAGFGGDIAFMVWATFDLIKLGRSAFSLAKATYTVVQISKISDPALRTTKMLANFSKVKPYVGAKVALRSFSGRMKGSMAAVVLGQRDLYTSQALPQIAGAGAANTTTAAILSNVSYDITKGGLVLDKAGAFGATAGTPGRVSEILKVENTLNIANENARTAYLSRSFFNKYKSYGSFLRDATQDAFRAGGYSGYSLEAGLNFGYDLKNIFPSMAAPEGVAGGVNSFKWYARPFSSMATANGSVELFVRSSAGVSAAEPLPVDITLNGTKFWPWAKRSISGISTDEIGKVLLTGDRPDNFRLAFGNASGLLETNPSFFKIGLDNENFAHLARLTVGGTDELRIKLAMNPLSRWESISNWGRNLLSSKDKMFAGEGSVWVREAGTGNLLPTPIKLKTSSQFGGIKVLVNEDNTLSLMGSKNGFAFPYRNSFALSLPKEQLGKFVSYAQKGNFMNPLQLSISASKDKVNTLYAVQFLSLSAASTGLIGPLRQNYPEMSNTQESLITVALPYAPSFLSPVWAPFVKRYGSATMMKVSLGLAATSLAISSASGFNGFKDANIYNPDKPSLFPLLLSSSFIGLSSSLTRASFNPLMKEMGGGGGLLKGMMYKNLSSFAMILPPLAFQAWDAASPRYYTNDGTFNGTPLIYNGKDVYVDGKLKIASGQPIVDEKGNPLLHKHTDFSISNPVLLGITGAILYKFHTARMSREIGAVKGYEIGGRVSPLFSGETSFAKFANGIYRPTVGLGKEAWTSTKVMFRKEVWPLTVAGFGALGVEAALFNKYSQSEANAYLRDENSDVYMKSEVWRPIAATFALAAPQFAVRYYSKPLIAALGGADNPLTYKKLIGLSLGSAALGTGILATEDNPYSFALGMSLIGAGFANTTNGILMTGEFNLARANAGKGVLTDWKVAYPAVHVGMSLVPLAHNYFADLEVAKDPDNPSKVKSLQDNIWIPASVLFGTGLFYAKGANLLKPGTLNTLAAPFKHGAALTVPYFRANDWLNRGAAPSFMPLYTPTFTPLSTESGNEGVEAESAAEVSAE